MVQRKGSRRQRPMLTLVVNNQKPASAMHRRKGSGGKRPILKLVVNNGFPSSPERPLPRKPKNTDVRPREYLRPDEVERLIHCESPF